MQPNNPLYIELKQKELIDAYFADGNGIDFENKAILNQLTDFLADETIRISTEEIQLFQRVMDPENYYHMIEHDDILKSPRYQNLMKLYQYYEGHREAIKNVLYNIWSTLLNDIEYDKYYLPFHKFKFNNYDKFIEQLHNHLKTYINAIDPYFVENYFHNERTSMFIDHQFYTTTPESEMFPSMIYQYTKHIIDYQMNALLKQALMIIDESPNDVYHLIEKPYNLLKAHVPSTVEQIYDVDKLNIEMIYKNLHTVETFYNLFDPWISFSELLMELPYHPNFLALSENEQIELFTKYFFEMRKLYINHIELYMNSIHEIDVKRSMMKEDFNHFRNYEFPEHLNELRDKLLPIIKYAPVYKAK